MYVFVTKHASTSHYGDWSSVTHGLCVVWSQSSWSAKLHMRVWTICEHCGPLQIHQVEELARYNL
jgi:hypothetical protein